MAKKKAVADRKPLQWHTGTFDNDKWDDGITYADWFFNIRTHSGIVVSVYLTREYTAEQTDFVVSCDQMGLDRKMDLPKGATVADAKRQALREFMRENNDIGVALLQYLIDTAKF